MIASLHIVGYSDLRTAVGTLDPPLFWVLPDKYLNEAITALFQIPSNISSFINHAAVYTDALEVINTACHLYSLRGCLWKLPRDRHVRWPCRGSESYLPVSHCGDRHLILGKSMWDLWWTKWHWAMFHCRVLRVSPVCTVPPMLHTRSLLSHRRCQLTRLYGVGDWEVNEYGALVELYNWRRFWIRSYVHFIVPIRVSWPC